MRTMRIALAAAVMGAVSLAPTQLSPADAVLSGRAATTSGGSIGTTTFVLYPTTTSTGANPNGTALTLSNSNAAQFFFVRNIGAKTLNSFSFSVTFTSTPTFTYKRCALNVLFTNATTCASAPTTPTTIALGTVTLAMAAGSWVEISITPNKTTTPTVSTQVSASNYTTSITNS